MARASACIANLEQWLDKAQRTGALGYINKEYRKRRIEAAAAGTPFPPYRMKPRIERALVGALTRDARSLTSQEFGP